MSPLGIAFGIALTAGVVVAWTPRSWRVSLAIASISIVAALWAVTAKSIRLPWQTIPVALIGVWGFIQLAFGASAIPHTTLRSSSLLAVSAIVFILGSQILQNRRARHSFLNLMLWVSTVLAGLAMLQTYTSPGLVLWLFPAEDSVLGTFYYRNQFAAFMEIAAPIALWQILRERVAVGGICYAVIFAATLTSASRSGVTLVSAELIIFLAFMVFQQQLPLKSAVSLVTVFALLLAGASIIAGTERTVNHFETPDFYDVARRQMANSTLKLIAERPWTGWGVGTWRAVYPRFATFDLAAIANEAHNDWLQWAAEGGIPFALLFAVLAIWLVKPSVESVWGMGVPMVLVHSYVDYPLREPAVAFLWFAMAGAVAQTTWASSTPGQDVMPVSSE